MLSVLDLPIKIIVFNAVMDMALVAPMPLTIQSLHQTPTLMFKLRTPLLVGILIIVQIA